MSESMPPQPSPNRFPDEFYADPIGRKRYVVQEKVLFEWLAPSKVDTLRSRQEIGQLVLGAIIVALILLLFQEVAMTIMWGVACLLFFISAFSQASTIKVQVTTLGVKLEDKYYYWEEMTQYWFEDRSPMKMVFFRIIWPSEMTLKLLYLPVDEEELLTTIGKYLLFKRPQRTLFIRFKESLRRILPPELEWF